MRLLRQWPNDFLAACGLLLAWGVGLANAQDVPVDGFLPMVGFGLTDEFDKDFVFSPILTESSEGASFLGPGSTSQNYGAPYYDVALLDTGAGFSMLTSEAYDAFNLDGPYPGESDGYAGTETITVGGATGEVQALINDPFGLYVGGLQGRSGDGEQLTMTNSELSGQANVSTITMPGPTALPNIVGLTYSSQYATRIRNDAPQVFELNGKTVRTPSIDFLPLGSGGNGITRKAPMSLNPGASFQSPPTYLLNIANFDIDNPQENPSAPTIMAAGSGGLFVNVDASNEGSSLGGTEFFFDTGASVTVVSELNALRLGFDILVDEPEFTIPVLGSSGSAIEVPGFFVDEFTIVALGGSITVNNVPVLVLDVVDVGDPGNIVDGILGTNLLQGRNLVIDPNPSLGGAGESAGLYISDPVTTDFNWTSTASNEQWSTGNNWDASATPDYLSVVELRHVAGGDQVAIVVGSQKASSVKVSGGASSETMTLRLVQDARLTTFSGMTIEEAGVVELQDATLDVQYVDVRGGRLTGDGVIRTGSGPIAGQVESTHGVVAPGVDGVGTLTIEGRYSNGNEGVLEIELGGLVPNGEHDQLVVEGPVSLEGTLDVSLVDLGEGVFAPSLGDTFTILTYEDFGGQFEQLLLPEGYQWQPHYNSTALVLEVTGLGLAGDFNNDGTVDTADYTVWRDGLGTTYTQDHYTQWRNNFGQTLASPEAGSAAVPEPAAWMLMLAGSCLAWRRRTPR